MAFVNNLTKTNTSGFNDPSIKMNVLSGQDYMYSPVYRLSAGLADAIVKRGMWLQLNADNELEQIQAATTGVRNAKMVLSPSTQSDTKAFKYKSDGTDAGGYMATVFGTHRFEVGSTLYDDTQTYTAGTELKIVRGSSGEGILTPADTTGDVVTGIAEGVDSRNMLIFTTNIEPLKV